VLFRERKLPMRRLRDTVLPDDLRRVEETLSELRSGVETAQSLFTIFGPDLPQSSRQIYAASPAAR
jgi:hypothetical protein